jgi:ParB-like chromosome segregation protein Spo0J
MLKVIPLKVEDIYMPAARKKELDPEKIEAITQALLAGEELKPIKVREGNGRYVLQKGSNRLEASKKVGETEIGAYIVQAPKF